MSSNISSSGKKIAVYAVCTAIVAIATFIIKIPAFAGGYINFGDTFIFIFAYLFGPLCALIAGGIGSSLADVFAGYVVWAPFTLVIKGLEGFACAILCKAFKAKGNECRLWGACAAGAAFSVAAAIMAAGYYFAAAIITSSLKGALVSIPENLIQGGISVAAAIIILFVMQLKSLKIK